MLEVLIAMVNGGLEIAVLLAVVYAYLASKALRGLFRPLRWGALLGLAASPGLAYGVESVLEREVVEGALSLVAALLTLSLILWAGWGWASPEATSEKPERKVGSVPRSLVFLDIMVLMALTGLDIALTVTRLLPQDTGLTTVELPRTLGMALLGLALAALVGMTLGKVGAAVSPQVASVITVLGLLIVLVQTGTTGVQVMLVRGVLPLTDWLLAIMVPLVNNSSDFYYALLAAGSSLAPLALWQRRRWSHVPEGLNSAQRRKLRAATRRMWSLLLSLLAMALLITGVLVFTVFASSSVYDPQPQPVALQGEDIVIPISSLEMGKLYKYSYSRDGVEVRFIAARLEDGSIQAALDACQICGGLGYMQEGENAICKACRAPIDMRTLGLGGGCNPMPLPYAVEGGTLTIPVSALEEAAPMFQ